MASKDQSLISDPEEQKWVVEISEILDHELKINFETPSVSLFQVPKTITTNKPEAYEPQQIGLGPLHHFRPQPYKKMEQKKLVVVRTVLQNPEINYFKVTLIAKVQQLVPVVRSCYDMFLQGEDKSLAWVFAIDGLFLLNLLQTYNSQMDKEKEEYLVRLKERAYDFKQNIREQYLRIKPVAIHIATSDDVPSSEVEVINSKNETQGESDDHFLHPLLRQKEIVVTDENYVEWEVALRVPHHQPQLPKVGPKTRSVAQDILMVENQIPFMVLKEIHKALHPVSAGNSSSSSTSTHEFSPSMFQTFCKIHSPLELCSNDQAPSSVQHLLHYMYYSIVNNVTQDQKTYEVVEYALDINLYNFFTNMPQKEIVLAYEQTISILETFSQSKILISSASTLHDEAGFEFYSLEQHKGIQNIGVCDKKIYLPCVTLNNDSEVILRNLVAYETITLDSNSFPLTEYMGLMCALITNVDDVKLLKRQTVIKGDLGNDEIAQLFIGMSSSIPTAKRKWISKLRKTIDEINKVYESSVRMKTYLLLKKLARSLLVVLKAIGGFVEASWKIVVFMVSIVTLFLLTWQAYCDAFGCGKMTATLLPYASS